MVGTLSMKIKRKDLDEVHDEFSELSLSCPATKIRRLDVELPPTMEEEPEFPAAAFKLPLPDELFVDINNRGEQLTAIVTEPTSSVPLNEERALILYKPLNTLPPKQMFQSPGSSEISLRVNSDFLPDFKDQIPLICWALFLFSDQIIWSGGSNNLVKVEEKPVSMNEKPAANDSLAVVPWVPSQFSVNDQGDISMAVEPMDAEEAEAMMEDKMCFGGEETESIGMGGLQQWQQHCMTPQPPQPTTPVMWSW